MQITHTDKNVHPLLQHCKEPVVAVVFALGCLMIWGLWFPLTLLAQTLPPLGREHPPMMSTSSGDMRGEPTMREGRERPRQNEDGMRSENDKQTNEQKPQMFRTKNEQALAKRRVQALVMSLTQFQKQIALIQKQGVTVPSTLSNNIDAVLNDIKTLSQSVAASKVGTTTPPALPPATPSNTSPQ